MRFFRWRAAIAAVVVSALTSGAFAQVRYVRPDGSDVQSGTSIALAWQTLAHAVDELNAGTLPFTEIHIARGSTTDVYSPGTGANDTFLVLKPVTIIGGYTFTFDGTMWTESRSPGDMSTLSGDLGGSPAVHSFHIMTIARLQSAVTLEGLRFTGGDARGQTFVAGQGGAILATENPYGEDEFSGYAGDLLISDCSFEGNAAHVGGAIESRGWSIKVADCKFIGNVVSGVSVLGVHGAAWGGAIDLSTGDESTWSSRLHVKRTLFQNNTLEREATAGGGGGAISVRYQSQSPLICANCTFVGNSCVADYAGLYSEGAGEGGAVFATHGGYTGDEKEDPIYNVPQFINCVFKDNTASTNGGGLSCRYGALLKDCTLSGNDAPTGAGGGFYGALKGNSITEFTNSIFWGNTAAVADATFTQYQYALASTFNSVAISYTCVEASAVATGAGNTNADPSFADAQLRLRPCSPLVNAGSASLLPEDVLNVDEDPSSTEPHPLDSDLTLRVKDGALDMGAFELTPGAAEQLLS